MSIQYDDEAQASQALGNPSLPPADLAVIAHRFRDLRGAVAKHPAVYPGLLEWLAKKGVAIDEVSNGEPSGEDDDGSALQNGASPEHAEANPLIEEESEDTPLIEEEAVPETDPPDSLAGGISDLAKEAASEIKDLWNSEDGTERLVNRGEIVFTAGKYIVIAIIVIVVLVFSFRSCSDSSQAKSVTCSQFNAMTLSEQDATLNTLLNAHKKQTGGSNLFLAHSQVMMGCFGNPSAKINDLINW